jgi:predicted RNase H-like HicB family nuclease/DNA-binding XRE family transcriptional regulator
MFIKPFEPLAVYKKDKESGGYIVFCPNVEGVFSEGETLEEARDMIKDALEGVIETALEENLDRYFNNKGYTPKNDEIVELIDINKKLQVAVSIKIARENAGYTQKEFAEKVGIKQQNISRYEKGKIIPSADRFLQLLSV